MTNAFSPVTLGHLTLKNRFVRSATHEYFGEADGSLGDRQFEIIKELARNEVGLIISAHACVTKWGRSSPEQNRINEDRFIEGFARLAEIVHAHGGKFVTQISHAGGKAPSMANEGRIGRSPSGLPMKDGTSTLAFTLDEINEVKEDFIRAAVRMKSAGVDGVQIHGAHGYMLSEFVNFVENKRTDDYGGNAENRVRLIREILEGIKEACGKEFPVLLKINSNTTEDNERYVEELIEMLRLLQDSGLDAVELSGTGFSNLKDVPTPFFLEAATKIRRSVDLPIILVGGTRRIEDVERALEAGIEAVSMSRPFISDPDLVAKFKRREAARCIHCNKCFILPKTTGKRCIFEK
ncbi:MAG: HisA/HisF-related TIM barrel protein [Erysipelotrichaceae bacterium]